MVPDLLVCEMKEGLLFVYRNEMNIIKKLVTVFKL